MTSVSERLKSELTMWPLWVDRTDERRIEDIKQKCVSWLFEEESGNFDKISDTIMYLIDIACKTRDQELLTSVVALNDTIFERITKLYLDINLKVARQFWSTNSSDVIGSFQFLRDTRYIEELYNIAVASLPTWSERQDEDQQFFRKITWALGEISTREFVDHRAIDALKKMAVMEPPIAAYWAKKQLNRRLGKNSPYATEDLSELPEVDYDWPHPDTSCEG